MAYPRPRTECLLVSNIRMTQFEDFNIHFKIDLNLMLMLEHFTDVFYPCIIIFTKCLLEVPIAHGVN